MDGIVQDCSNSIANALGLLQSSTKPLIYQFTNKQFSVSIVSSWRKWLQFSISAQSRPHSIDERVKAVPIDLGNSDINEYVRLNILKERVIFVLNNGLNRVSAKQKNQEQYIVCGYFCLFWYEDLIVLAFVIMILMYMILLWVSLLVWTYRACNWVHERNV